MSTIEFSVERELPCVCLALSDTPFEACPECDGCGVSWQEIDLEVEYRYSKGMRGSRDRWGVPLEPDDPEEVEIQSVQDANGKEVDLTKDEMDHLEEKCMDDAAERSMDYDE